MNGTGCVKDNLPLCPTPGMIVHGDRKLIVAVKRLTEGYRRKKIVYVLHYLTVVLTVLSETIFNSQWK